MTNKEQIIIDGVDVSECEFYSSSENCLEFNGKYTIDICDSTKCSNNPNCYFKQLKHKEQECEELKERLVKTEEDLKYQCVDCMNVKSDRYRKALEEIETELSHNPTTIASYKIHDIINQIKYNII